MKKSVYILIFLLYIGILPVMAEDSFFDRHEISIGYAPWCEHLFSDNPKYNERDNHLFMLSFDQWFIMTFRNSYYDRSWAVGYTFRTGKLEPFKNDFFVRGNFAIGLVYGYENKKIEFGGVSPSAIPTVEVGYKNFSIHTTVIPVASLMFTWTF